MALCTAADIKTLRGRTDSADDALMTHMCVVASNWFALEAARLDAETGASLLESFVDRVETYPGGAPYVDLGGLPIVEIGELVAAWAIDDLDTETPLVENVDYMRRGSRLICLTAGADAGDWFTPGGGWLRATYSGGWWPADNTSPVGAGFTAVPAHVRRAVALLADHLFQHRDHFGQQTFNVGTATIDSVVRDVNVVGAITAALAPLKSAARIGIG